MELKTEKATLGFRTYQIWKISKRFAGTYYQAQTLKLGGVCRYPKPRIQVPVMPLVLRYLYNHHICLHNNGITHFTMPFPFFFFKYSRI